MDRLLEHIIRDFYTIDEAYSPKIIKQLIDKFKQELEDFNMDPIGDKTLDSYIKRFDQLKNSPKVKEKDLIKWNINDLVRLVTSSPSSLDIDEDEGYLTTGNDPVFENDYIQVFHAGNQPTCTRLKSFDPNREGPSGESWCIGRGSFSSYRFSDYRSTPSFYYIVDKLKFNDVRGSKSHTDFAKSFFVIQIRSNGEYVYTNRINSPHESNEMDWDRLTNHFPILASQNVRQYLKFMPLSTSEKLMGKYGSGNRRMPVKEFLKLKFSAKKQYLVIKDGDKLFDEIANKDFVLKILPNLPKLGDFISITYGLIEQMILLETLESFTNQQAKSIIQNLREVTINHLSHPLISWDVKKLLVKYASDKFVSTSTNKNSYSFPFMGGDEKMVFVYSGIQNYEKHDGLTAITPNDNYNNVKITSRSEKYLEGADLSVIPAKAILKAVVSKRLPYSVLGNTIEKIKKGEIEGYDYKEYKGEKYIINTNEAEAYNIKDDMLENVPFDSPEISELLGDDFKKTALQAFTQDSVGDNLETLARIVATASPNERIVTNPNINDGRPVILFVNEELQDEERDPRFFERNEIHVFPTEVSQINSPTCKIGSYGGQSGTYKRQNQNNTPLSVFGNILNNYFNFLRSTNQSFSRANLDIMFRTHPGINEFIRRKFIALNPPVAEDSGIALKYWEPNDTYYIINKVNPLQSHKISPNTGKKVKVSITSRLYATIMGVTPTAPAAPAAPGAPAAPAAPGTLRRGRPAGGARVYDLTALPPIPAHPTLQSAENVITGYGLNWNGLSDRVKYALHDHATPRNLEGRGVSRRRRQLRGTPLRVTHFWTVDTEASCAMYLLQRMDNEGELEPLAMNLVIKPGNEHWLATTNNATRMTTANVANAVQNLNESIDVKKYILKETIYQQNKETMKISELQALVKKAIQEVLTENESIKKQQNAQWKRDVLNKEAQGMYNKPFQDLEDWQRDEVYAKIEFRDSFQTENQPERSPEIPDRGTETLPDPGTKPGRTTRRRKIGNPDVDPKPKADLEEAEKEIMKMITQRFKAGQDA